MYEAGERHSRPQGAAPHPHRSLALVATNPPARAPRKRRSTIALPDFPHAGRVSRNNGKIKLSGNFPLCKDIAGIAHRACDGIGMPAR